MKHIKTLSKNISEREKELDRLTGEITRCEAADDAAQATAATVEAIRQRRTELTAKAFIAHEQANLPRQPQRQSRRASQATRPALVWQSSRRAPTRSGPRSRNLSTNDASRLRLHWQQSARQQLACTSKRLMHSGRSSLRWSRRTDSFGKSANPARCASYPGRPCSHAFAKSDCLFHGTGQDASGRSRVLHTGCCLEYGKPFRSTRTMNRYWPHPTGCMTTRCPTRLLKRQRANCARQASMSDT
jgi:hypothetical protein